MWGIRAGARHVGQRKLSWLTPAAAGGNLVDLRVGVAVDIILIDVIVFRLDIAIDKATTTARRAHHVLDGVGKLAGGNAGDLLRAKNDQNNE